jgi:phage terminase Nu1 subunit (DNA packaging protein)
MSKDKIAELLNLTQFARLCGVSAATVSTWCDEGMPCKRTARSGSAVEIDLRKAIRWLLKRRAAKPTAEKTNVAHEQAERLRIQNRRARGELLEVHLVEETLKAAVAGLLQDWDALAQRVTPDEKLQAAIAAECRTAQKRFAEKLAEISNDLDARADAIGKDEV